VLLLLASLSLAFMVAGSPRLSAQYFGRNKVRYEDFDFKVMSTQHFDIHFYPEEEQAVRDASRMAERWYTRLSRFFGHQLSSRKPIILYANQGDFQQTFVTSELISEGTGGFTEPLQDRVVLPLTGWYAGNDHVLGHELVHLFQYDMVQARGDEGLQAMNMLPLWFIEGMAEYLSIGRNDPNTAMWLRDVLLRDKIPTIDEITRDPRYFPYRYGQAIWAYIGGKWGDDMIPKLYRSAITNGWEIAIKRQLNLSVEELSKEWIASIKSMYGGEVAARTKPESIGHRVFNEGEGDMYVSPAVSPDGKQVVFLSSRDVFTIDLYLGDVQTGKVVDKLLSAQSNPHLDALRFINSAGSWSPDGKKFVTVVYEQGNDQLSIIDVPSRDEEATLRFNDIGEISNPSWSPDGKEIAFSGSHGGITDLYTVEVATKRLRRLTNDRFADMQPAWSPDGNTIAFSTDRGTETDFAALRYSPLRLATIDVKSGAITVLPRFADAKNINPQYTPDGRDIYFVADPDGFADIYRVSLATNEVSRVTRIATGVSGITGQSPAITVAHTSGELLFSVFEKGDYQIFSIDPAAARGMAAAGDTSSVIGGILPPPPGGNTSEVSTYLADATTGLSAKSDYPVEPYHATLHLDYLGTPTVGVAVGPFGTGFAGGISGYFSDLLGYHELAATLQMNGTVEDIGGQAQYLYTRNRWNWGVGVSHIPYLSYFTTANPTTYEDPNLGPVQAAAYSQYSERVFDDQLQLIGAYPFSTTRRIEFTAGYERISYGLDVTSQVVVGSTVVAQVDSSLPAPAGLNLLQGAAAYVGDNSYFGFTSPVAGERFRAEVGGTAGSLKFGTLLLDYRKYFFANPVTFAVRGMHYGRYGSGGESDQLNPLFIGYESFVRGYSNTSFDASECSSDSVALATGSCPEFDRLLGSRIALASAEVRVPLFGPSGCGLVHFPFLPTELSAFVDGGAAWTSTEKPVLEFKRNTTERVPVFSAGLSARFNLFGYAVLEVFYAYPFQRPMAGWQWGFQIAPGW
jgi:Tol biopolymer transport system component